MTNEFTNPYFMDGDFTELKKKRNYDYLFPPLTCPVVCTISITQYQVTINIQISMCTKTHVTAITFPEPHNDYVK